MLSIIPGTDLVLLHRSYPGVLISSWHQTHLCASCSVLGGGLSEVRAGAPLADRGHSRTGNGGAVMRTGSEDSPKCHICPSPASASRNLSPSRSS